MTNNKQTWLEEYKLRYVPNCGDDEVCIAFWKDNMDYIEKTLQEQREEIRRAEKDRVIRIVTEYFEKGLGFNEGSMNDSVFEGLKDALLKELKK